MKSEKMNIIKNFILDIVQILSLAVIFFTLLEMKTERNMQYKPNLVFSPSYYVIGETYETDEKRYEDVERMYERMSVFNPDAINMNVVVDNNIDPNADEMKTKYQMFSSLTNIGAGNATDIKIQISKDSIRRAIEELNNDTARRNESASSDRQIELLSFEDYVDEKVDMGIIEDEIQHCNGKKEYNSINLSAGTTFVPYLLSNQENAYKLFLPEIYYSLACEVAQIMEKDRNTYASFNFPSILMTISYDDVHGKKYSYDYEIHTNFTRSYFEPERHYVALITVEKVE